MGLSGQEAGKFREEGGEKKKQRVEAKKGA